MKRGEKLNFSLKQQWVVAEEQINSNGQLVSSDIFLKVFIWNTKIQTMNSKKRETST